MGECSAMMSIKAVMNNTHSIGHGIMGLKFTEFLLKQLRKLRINFEKDAEVDIVTFYSNGTKVNVVFGESKVLQNLEPSSKQFKDKVNESLKQTRRDLSLFLSINPDLTEEDLQNINMVTLSILPTTNLAKVNVCQDCHSFIVFRDDLNPECKDQESLADLFDQDLADISKSKSNEKLRQKLQVDAYMSG